MSINLKELDQLIEDFDPSNKLELYEHIKSELKNGDNSEMMWRLAKISLILSAAAEKEQNKELEKRFIEEALLYSEKSVGLDPNNVKCHKWYCASLGKMSKFVGTKQKISFGHKFKQHVDIAIKLDPNDHLLHYMFGRFCFELSSLSWIERKIANTIFGSVPKSSFNEALTHFLSCDRLKPQWKDNYLWVAKTLIQLKRYEEAKNWVNCGVVLAINNLLDEVSHNHLIKLKTKHKF